MFDKPIEYALLDFVREMRKTFEGVVHKNEGFFGSKSMKKGAENMVLAYGTVERHIVSEIELRNKIKDNTVIPVEDVGKVHIPYGPLLPSVRNREIVKLSLNIGRLKKKVARYEGMIVDDEKNMGAQEIILKIERSLKVLQVFPQL